MLPLSKKITEKETKELSEEQLSKKAIKYTALVNLESEEYTFSLKPLKELKFNAFKAEAIFTANSEVTLKVSDGRFKPKAALYGSMNINASNSETKTTATTVVEQRIHGLLQHALLVAHDDVRRVEIDRKSVV